jgi:chromosome segregation ATPase
MAEVKDKLAKQRKETQDLKYELQKKTMEVEMKDKKIAELNQLIKELKQYNPAPAEN